MSFRVRLVLAVIVVLVALWAMNPGSDGSTPFDELGLVTKAAR